LQVEGDTDVLLNRSRLVEDYRTANAGRQGRLAEVESRLATGTGTAWLAEMIDAQNRYNEQKQQEAEEGAPVDKVPGINKKISQANKKIKTLRTKAKKTNNPRKKKALQKKVQNTRKRRDALVKKKAKK